MLAAAAGAVWMLRPLSRPRPRPETLAVLAIALLYRLPAVIHPWGWVNTDGAYGAFIALRLLAGARPAPVFTLGASYQGTLKGHLAALFSLVSGAEDLSRMLVLASLLLDLLFIAATMTLARRIGGRAAALASGLYLALGPKFLTVFSLNSVGQYVDVLALGGLALALLASLLQDEPSPRDRLRALAVGLLLGAAFWQQPVATCYVDRRLRGSGAAARARARDRGGVGRSPACWSARFPSSSSTCDMAGPAATSWGRTRPACARKWRRFPTSCEGPRTRRFPSWPASARGTRGSRSAVEPCAWPPVS